MMDHDEFMGNFKDLLKLSLIYAVAFFIYYIIEKLFL